MERAIPDNVNKVFESYPANARQRLLEIRELIFKHASADESIGELTETLKWGEPAYLTEQSGSGSTIRLGYKDKQPDKVAIYFNCQTTIVKHIQQRFDGLFECVDNRAVLIPLEDPLRRDALSDCIDISLKYHLNKKVKSTGLL